MSQRDEPVSSRRPKWLFSSLRSYLRRRFGPPPRQILYESDQAFHDAYDLAQKVTQGRPNPHRRERFYNLVQFLNLALPLPGDVAECGCFRGFSSLLLCQWLRRHDPGFKGAGYRIFDSFKGLSPPGGKDHVPTAVGQKFSREFGGVNGALSASLETVRANLSDFPDIAYHEGYIPDTFKGLEERTYRFVHVDVDLYQPTKDSLLYFYPRLVQGGLIVCDDYGLLNWPGARAALDEFASEAGIEVLTNSTGQGILWKRT